MKDKKILELVERFEDLTLKKQMKILALKAAGSKSIFFKEILREFEKTLLQAYLEKYDHNISKMSLGIKIHRNTIQKKMKKWNIKEKKRKQT